MESLDKHLEDLDPEVARNIRDAASRAGLQAHDPAARMIAEMWVAVAALRKERDELRREFGQLSTRSRIGHQILLVLIVLGTANLVAVLTLLFD